MKMVVQAGDSWGIAEGLEAVAALRSDSEPLDAVLLAAAAEQLRERISMRQHPVDAIINLRYLGRAREQMTAEAFQETWAAGRAMPLDEAVELGLGEAGHTT